MPYLSLREAPAHPELIEGRGNPDGVKHPSAHRHCYRNEIATLRSHPSCQRIRASHAHLICHCEERSDAAISMGSNTRRRTAVATATGLPRYARIRVVNASGQATRTLFVIARSVATWQSRWGHTPIGAPQLLRQRDCHATLAMTIRDNRKTLRARAVPPATPAAYAIMPELSSVFSGAR